MVRYLLSRATETTKLGKEWKFAVVEAAAAPRGGGRGSDRRGGGAAAAGVAEAAGAPPSVVGGVDGVARATLGDGVADELRRVLVQGPFFVAASSAINDVTTM